MTANINIVNTMLQDKSDNRIRCRHLCVNIRIHNSAGSYSYNLYEQRVIELNSTEMQINFLNDLNFFFLALNSVVLKYSIFPQKYTLK